MWALVRRPPFYPALAGFAVAIVAMFAAGSVFRSYGTHPDQAAEGRYVILVGYLLAFGIAAAAPKIRHARWLVPVAVVAFALNIIALAAAWSKYP